MEAATPAAAPGVAQGIRPSLEEVIAAVESLHTDQLKPSGRILRKRIAERASGLTMEAVYGAPAGSGQAPLPEVDVGHLRSLCEGCRALCMEADEGGDWSAVLVGRSTVFVDVHSVEDIYPDELWAAAEAYFLSLDGMEMKLPGGRYACAQALLGRKLDFLTGCSLGQVCHIVQLAISERKILGYCSGTVVPYGHSQSMMKERCAEQQQPIAPSGAPAGEDAPAMPLATWDVARKLLGEIFEEATQPGREGPPMVPLSNIKRLFRSRYHTELSETMLGHSRMADLMQDERFQDMCTLRLQKGGYVVIGKEPSPSHKAAASSKTISLADTILSEARTGEAIISLASGLRLDGSGPRPGSSEAGQTQPLRLELCLGQRMRWGDIEDEPSGDAFEPPLSMPLATPLPSPGVAGDDAMVRWMAKPKPPSFCTDEPLRLEDAAPVAAGAVTSRASLPTPLPSPGEPPSATVRRWAAAPRRAEFFPAADTKASSAGKVVEAGSLRLPLAPREEETPSAPSVDPTPPGRARTPKPAGSGLWCPDEPLRLEDAGSGSLALPTPLASPGEPGSATVRRWAGAGGGAPRRLEFFLDEPLAPERVAQETPCLPARTSPESKPAGGWKLGPNGSPGLCDGARLVEAIPSPLRSTQAFRTGAAGGGLTPLAREICEGAAQGCPSSFVKNTFIHARLPPSTPLGAAVRSQSLPKDAGTSAGDSEVEEVAPTQALDMPRWLAPSPRERCLALVVRNTFLHSAPLPQTPAFGAARRSQSVPPEARPGDGILEHPLRALEAVAGQRGAPPAARGGSRLSAAGALPAVTPAGPSLASSPTKCRARLAPRFATGATQRVVQLADHV